MKKILFFLSISLVFISCAKGKIETLAEPVPTAKVTATPLSFGSLYPPADPLSWLISENFEFGVNCTRVEKLKQTHLHPSFSLVDGFVDPEIEFVSEVADSIDKTYRAYIINDVNDDKLLVGNKRNGQFYKINFNLFPPNSGAILFDVIWIENSILLVHQSQSAEFYLIVGINMNIQDFAYISETSCGD